MINTVYRILKRIPILGRFVHRFGQGLPPGWLFIRSIVEWTSKDRIIRKQLPILYRLFGVYCGVYFRLRPSAEVLVGGRLVLRLITILHNLLVKNGYAMMVIDGYTACIDLSDPRFLLVVNELRHQTDTAILSRLIEEGDTFVDVGANQGAFSIIAADLVGKNGRVVAIEPQARLAKAIELSLAQSPVSRYEVHQVAVGDHNGEINLIVPLSYTGSAGLYKSFSGTDGYTETTVSMRKFDDLVDWNNFPRKVFIKLDIEGAETSFFRGASAMITTLQPTILMEINLNAMQASNTSIEELKEQLSALGYHTYAESQNLSEVLPIEELSSAHRNIVLTAS
jgi:FkbM family methyltransferase